MFVTAQCDKCKRTDIPDESKDRFLYGNDSQLPRMWGFISQFDGETGRKILSLYCPACYPTARQEISAAVEIFNNSGRGLGSK